MTTFYKLIGHTVKYFMPKSAVGTGNLLLLALGSLLISAGASQAQTYPASFTQVQVTNGLSGPTAMVFAPDGRIFVTLQSGDLRVIKNGALLPTPFVHLTVDDNGERGLIGVVLDPAFSTNHYIYLYHTVPGTPAHNRISRYTANGDVVLANSEVEILDLDPLSSATNHNGGAMVFGPDGKLYVGVGENANGPNAQNLDTHLGKILRINADGSAPADNPFPSGTEQRKRVWAYGLRNPYTIAIQPGTGRIFVNDVGQSTWEEINDATTGGLNFGWPTAEGTSNNVAFTNPVYSYPHTPTGDGNGCAITGGTFFNPTTTNYPSSFIGKYFFQDLCGSWINNINLSVNPATRSSFATSLPGNSLAISTGLDGNLYYLSRDASALYKIIYTPTTPDLTPSLVLPQASFSASGSVGNFVVSLFEVNGHPTSPASVSITVTAPLGYTLAFAPSITSINVSGGTSNPVTVSNANWTVTSTIDNRQISLVLKAGQLIGAGGMANLGFSITRTNANSGSTTSINVNVTNDASNGYDSNITNNIYARIISAL
ncbi:PQQ-dependent sugar dehydrogenase [Spirosoma migulaei]